MDEARREEIRDLLPWYVNEGLSPGERRLVEEALGEDTALQAEAAGLRRLAQAVSEQPQSAPPADLLVRVRRRLGAPAGSWRRWASWAVAIVLALAMILGLWSSLEPGVELQWSVAKGTPTSFRIYRAPADGGSFILLDEITARPAANEYRYIDEVIGPGRVYAYQVEALDAGGDSTFSPAVLADTQEVLLIQLAILFTGLAAGAGGWLLARRWGRRPLVFGALGSV
jgi:hypothetical protein